jgi:acyl dehydratase
MTIKPRYYEDFEPGDTIVTPGKTITESEIIDYAFRYDPQPFHIDREAAAEHMYGGLIASGFLIVSIAFRLFTMTNPFGDASLGSPGIDQMRWLMPVRPDDTIRVEVDITATRRSRSKPDRGLIDLDWRVLNQLNQVVTTMQSVQLVRCRGA